ncbi:MAG: NAD(P)H-hydrate dehydratase [Clostridia bacterium]|nr:NAD(P)H-hydrate dehydratase [Clostridia bacterium]
MKVLTSLQIKNAEKSAVSNGLFSYKELMRSAAQSVYSEMKSRYKTVGKRILIIAGSGNNGGDGIVLADLLRNTGAAVYLCFPCGEPTAEPAVEYLPAVADLPRVYDLSGIYDFYIDALFGIGFRDSLPQNIETLIKEINHRPGVKIAIDIPSGMYADRSASGVHFKADLTVTFIGYKQCQILPPDSSDCGEVVLKDLNIDVKNEYNYSIIEPPIPRKYSKNAHKGTFGTVLTVCGSYGMCGAGILSAKAALIGGAGIVKSVVCSNNYPAFTSAVPEAVTVPVDTSLNGAPFLNDKRVFSAISSADSLLIGCGLGRSDEVVNGIYKILPAISIPTVIDADGINAVAANINILKNVNAPLVFTPHPGEMAALLNTTVEDVQCNRVLYAKKFACDNQCTLVLKGANTIVASENGEIFINITGNYGMGKGGSGDVLSGIIAALLANGYDPLEAAKTAVYVHGAAGDAAALKYTKRTMLPTDLLEELKFITF